MDRTLPRMKKSYRRALYSVAFWKRTPIIHARNPSFIDYCHPDERTCGDIADAIARIIWKDYRRRSFNFLHRKEIKQGEPPPNIYAGLV